MVQLHRPNKKISMVRVTGLKTIGRVGTHIIFLIISFSEKKMYNFMHFERQFCLSKRIKIIFFPENLKKSRFHQ